MNRAGLSQDEKISPSWFMAATSDHAGLPNPKSAWACPCSPEGLPPPHPAQHDEAWDDAFADVDVGHRRRHVGATFGQDVSEYWVNICEVAGGCDGYPSVRGHGGQADGTILAPMSGAATWTQRA